MKSLHSVAAHWRGGWDENGLREWVTGLSSRLPSRSATLGLVFLAPKYFPHASEILEILRVDGRIPLLAGCSSQSLIVNENEIEEDAGIALGLYHLPGAELRGVAIDQAKLQSTTSASNWHQITEQAPGRTRGWLAFVDPFHLDGESWLREWNDAFPGIPTVGGLASGDPNDQRTQLYLNGEVFEEGAVLISVGGRLAVETVTSQGCTPIGEAWTITKADRNYIVSIANRPAYHVLLDTYNGLTADEQRQAQNNLFVGFASSEYRHEFHRGDFLVRNLLGADPRNGALAVGAWPRAGQTIQFHRRDSTAATEDLNFWLDQTRRRLSGKVIYGGCLCSCNGRGARLFGKPNHDAGPYPGTPGPFRSRRLFLQWRTWPCRRQKLSARLHCFPGLVC
jgi:small ligand-binding sensory domain FIST